MAAASAQANAQHQRQRRAKYKQQKGEENFERLASEVRDRADENARRSSTGRAARRRRRRGGGATAATAECAAATERRVYYETYASACATETVHHCATISLTERFISAELRNCWRTDIKK